LTQPRILLLYLSQLFYPVPTRLSFEHDLTFSTSLFTPWTTLPSILIATGLIIFAVLRIRQYPLLSFGLLFFFLNHAVESSILPLELVFEHRNYLPSMFLFLPASAALNNLLCRYRDKRSGMVYLLHGFIILLVVGFGCSTYLRNKAWASERTLWEDSLKKAPHSARAHLNLGRVYDRAGDRQTALALYLESLKCRSDRPTDTRLVALNNIGNIYYSRSNYTQAIEIWSRAIEQVRDHRLLRCNLALAYAGLRDWEKAVCELDKLLERWPNHGRYNFLKGCFLMELNQFDAALHHLRRGLMGGYNSRKVLANIGIAYYHLEQYGSAEHFIQRSAGRRSKSLETLFWLLGINLNLGDQRDVDLYAKAILKKASTAELSAWIDQISDSDYHLYRDRDRIIASLRQRIQ